MKKIIISAFGLAVLVAGAVVAVTLVQRSQKTIARASTLLCGSGLECKSSRVVGSFQCSSPANSALVWCCASGQVIVNSGGTNICDSITKEVSTNPCEAGLNCKRIETYLAGSTYCMSGAQQVHCCSSEQIIVTLPNGTLACDYPTSGGLTLPTTAPTASCSGSCYSGSLCQFYPPGECPAGSDRQMENCGSAGLISASGSCDSSGGGFCCNGTPPDTRKQAPKCGSTIILVNGPYIDRKGQVQNGWHTATVDEVAHLKPGDIMRLGINAGNKPGRVNADIDFENFKKARFTINGAVPVETTNYVNVPSCFPNCTSASRGVLVGRRFSYDYVLKPTDSAFTIKGELYFEGGGVTGWY